MPRFWDNLVPTAILSVVLSSLGLSVLLYTASDLNSLMSPWANLYIAVCLLGSSFIGGLYLGAQVKEDFLSNGIALGALVALGQLVILVPILDRIVGTSTLRAVNSLGGVVILTVLMDMTGSILGMMPSYLIYWETL